ncbi:telomere-protecting terminal protein Tpg [Streptomyces genisteinicus]|uniref:XRE family transcriptional regulator n=1 Tax=Streptomyces genisteinicus TaxID=2768068 RepID=A0A7H0I1U2_9ACTN|nr:XRE family transcriptional regulator [Streptomyces genisteinicus]QNP66758.1 XRE family transcriptional regulator [Streptomyces genisteinicus]
MGKVADGLEEAVRAAFTRPVPKTAGAQMRYLVKQLKGTRGAAAALGVSQRTVERYVTGEFRHPRRELAERLRAEVTRRWQPQVRARARRRAATTDGILVDTRARFGYTAAPGSSDDARLRHLTVALPPQFAARLLDTAQQGGTERELRDIAAEALQEIYFKDGGRRAHGLAVEFTDVEHIEFEI